MKTTAKHFKYFKTRVEFWLIVLNLQNYGVHIIHEYLTQDGTTCKGFCTPNIPAKNAVIGLGKDWGNKICNPINNIELDRTALHECLELLLFDLVEMIETRFMDAANIEPAKHTVIQTLVKALMNV